MYNTIAEIKRANDYIGGHFFNKESLVFFDSKIGRTVYGGRYFITSEQFHGSDEYDGPRLYTIRECVNGKINTIGEFNVIHSLNAAKALLINLLEGNTVSLETYMASRRGLSKKELGQN